MSPLPLECGDQLQLFKPLDAPLRRFTHKILDIIRINCFVCRKINKFSLIAVLLPDAAPPTRNMTCPYFAPLFGETYASQDIAKKIS